MLESSYDGLAAYYAFLERVLFGPTLQRSRVALLPRISHCQRVLILGDGDGRLLRALFSMQGHTFRGRVDVVDWSRSMNLLSAARLTDTESKRVTYHQVDARNFLTTAHGYDAVITPFFLDGFAQDDVKALLGLIWSAVQAEGFWLDVDFRMPARGWRRLRARVWIYLLYKAFKWTAGVQVNQLVRIVVDTLKFELRKERYFSAHLLSARLYSRVA